MKYQKLDMVMKVIRTSALPTPINKKNGVIKSLPNILLRKYLKNKLSYQYEIIFSDSKALNCQWYLQELMKQKKLSLQGLWSLVHWIKLYNGRTCYGKYDLYPRTGRIKLDSHNVPVEIGGLRERLGRDGKSSYTSKLGRGKWSQNVCSCRIRNWCILFLHISPGAIWKRSLINIHKSVKGLSSISQPNIFFIIMWGCVSCWIDWPASSQLST